MAGLLALASAGFITVLTEALPAGLLLPMSKDLAASESLIGQLVTLYAVGSLVAAIPLTTATRSWRRRPLLLLAIAGFIIANTVTALSTSYALTLVARFFAGISAGLLWALVAGYAVRMVAPHLKGRAIAVAMLGTPLALSLGIPAGTLLGNMVGWRYTFGIMSVLSVFLLGWVRWKVPDFAGQSAERQMPLGRVFALPGISAVLGAMFALVLAHNILYTYVAPFLAPAGLSGQVDRLLLVFGGASLLGIWIVGAGIDRWLRELTLINTALFLLAALGLAIWSEQPIAIYAGFLIWGLAFGGCATLFQTASAHAAGDAADQAQSMIVTVWNLAIMGGGVIGGLLLDNVGPASFPWTATILLMVSLLIAWRARQHGFPAAPSTAKSSG
jgi:predicted MFS family arabinose efflux permease